MAADALARFREAQEGVIDRALAELRAGAKRTHWMWFVFPQVAGLGTSATSRRYAIADLAEARAYLADPTLGPRLLACVEAALACGEDDPRRILGEVDALKLRSSLTLFAQADPDAAAFRAALDRFFDGAPDPRTLEILGRPQPG